MTLTPNDQITLKRLQHGPRMMAKIGKQARHSLYRLKKVGLVEQFTYIPQFSRPVMWKLTDEGMIIATVLFRDIKDFKAAIV